jgi:hypothetical protein
VSTIHIAKQVAALLVFGVLGATLAACSSQPAASVPTTRPGTGELTIKAAPPLTEVQASQLVREGCTSLAGVGAVVTSAIYLHSPSNALQALSHGPWYKAVSMSEAGRFPEFTRVAAAAKDLDLATIASLKSESTTRVTSSVNQLILNCKTIGVPTG